jgi:hypothetical protein
VTKQRKTNDRKPADDWLPDPKDVIEEIEVHSPVSGDFTIQRTLETDPYDDPLPPADRVTRGKAPRPKTRR